MHKRKLQKYNQVKTVKAKRVTVSRSGVAANITKRRPFNPNK